MDYNKSLKYLKDLESLGIRFRLENTKDLLSSLGFSYDGVIVHVAGTNGKGSCAATLASILQSSGKKTGLYISPELIDFRERITLEGKMISCGRFSELVSEMEPIIDSMPDKPTFFEATTALALKYFADEKAEFMVLEAGMGGRLDSTRAVEGDLSIITNVSLDHKKYLGETVEAIALEKAGIITPKKTVITAASEPALSVISAESEKKNSKIMRVGREIQLYGVSSSFEGSTFTLKTESKTYCIKSPLVGYFQAENIACAVAAAEELGIAADKITDGAAKTIWPARLHVVSEKPRVIIDCAHNPEAVEKSLDFVRKNTPSENLIAIAGFSKDKDYKKALYNLKPSDVLIATKYSGDRALEPKRILEHAKGTAQPDIGKALFYALSLASENDTILVFGSIFLAREAMAFFLK
jgi:dihydrofolate synthase / folylpolyglutamate synthase